jgi:hypothetical protein
MNIPSRLARYAAAADASSPPAPRPPPPCLWHGCGLSRTGTIFCGTHTAACRRLVIAGKLPPMAELADMRPSQIAALTEPPPAPPIVIRPPRPPPPPRVCLWPDCGRAASLRSYCPRCRARRRAMEKRGTVLPAAADLPATWDAHIVALRARQRVQGWPPSPAVRIDHGASVQGGGCSAIGCESSVCYARGLCGRCYRRARYRGQLQQFPGQRC